MRSRAVRVLWTVSQSPNSLEVWNRAMRRNAAYATLPPSCSAVAPLRIASLIDAIVM